MVRLLRSALDLFFSWVLVFFTLSCSVEVRDCHFLIDPVDHHHLTTNGHFIEYDTDNIPQPYQLKEALPQGNIRVCKFTHATLSCGDTYLANTRRLVSTLAPSLVRCLSPP